MKHQLVLFWMILLVCFASGQNTDTNSLRYSTGEDGDIQLETANEAIPEMYDLRDKRAIMAKILNDADMKKGPSPGSESLGLTIPKGEVVEAYLYFSDENTWAIKYKERWGFIPDIVVFPIHQSTTEDKATGYDEPPQLKTAIQPEYPPEAEEKGIKGRVYVKVYINEKGKATETIILKGIPELNDAAAEAVRRARYSPARLNGKPVGVWINLSINFK